MPSQLQFNELVVKGIKCRPTFPFAFQQQILSVSQDLWAIGSNLAFFHRHFRLSFHSRPRTRLIVKGPFLMKYGPRAKDNFGPELCVLRRGVDVDVE